MLSNNYFAGNLQFLRTRKRLSQLELAEKLKLTRSKIASYESGKAEPNSQKLAEIVRYFDIDLVRLVEADLQQEPDKAGKAAVSAPTRNPDHAAAIQGFEQQYAQMRRIADGLQAQRELKNRNLRDLPADALRAQRDLDNLLEFVHNLLAFDEELLSYLKNMA